MPRKTVRWALACVAGLFGLLVAARALLGPFSFPVSVHTPIHIESICALGLTLAFALRAGGKGGGDPAAPFPIAGRVLCVAAICGLAALGLWRALHIYFLADDFVLVKFANAFRAHDLPGLFTTPEGNAFFRPAVRVSMALNAYWAHSDPGRWHAASLALHAVNAGLVFALAWRLGLSLGGALFAGALFAIHGSVPESAVWIAGWYGLLSTFFVLCGLLAFLAHLQLKDRRRWYYGAASLVLMVLAFLSKETAYAFPLLAVLLALWRASLRRAAPILAAFFAAAAGIFLYRWHLLGGIGGYPELHLTAVHVLQGLLLRLWAVLYFPINWSAPPGLILGALLAAYIGALLWIAWRGGRRLLLPIGFVLLAALPPIHELLIGPDIQKSRELYLPLVGFCLLLAMAAADLPGKYVRRIVPAILLLFQFAALQHNLGAWQRAGDAAKQVCAAAARGGDVGKPPGSLDGVYFLGVGFPECAQMSNSQR